MNLKQLIMGITQCKISKSELSEAELNALVSATEMTKSEIIKWHKGKRSILFDSIRFIRRAKCVYY